MSRPKSKKQMAVGRLTIQRQGEQAVELIEGKTDSPLHQKVIRLKSPAPVVAGEYLVVALEKVADNLYEAHYERRLGPAPSPGIEADIATILYNLPQGWSPALTEAARQLAQKPPAQTAGKKRRDLRQLPFVTIDDESAKDHDDAVYCEAIKAGGWRLWVAIADVSAYVTEGSALDEAAQARGTSVYFPQAVIPMLPEVLSNDICSLKPDVDRLCLICEMTFSASGERSDYRFYEGLIRSGGRLTYNEVEAVLTSHTQDQGTAAAHTQALRTLAALYQKLCELRKQRGAVDVEVTQSLFAFDAKGRVKQALCLTRGDAHKIIEECMISANVCAADFINELPLPALYRVHEPPPQTDHLALANFARSLNLNLDTHATPRPKDYQRLANQLAEKDHTGAAALQVLRALSKAQYQTRNIGHFGLALEAYTHFTSPIRRYADLIVHRAIKAGIALHQQGKHQFDYSEAALEAIAETINSCARRAEWAARFAENWLKCGLMQHRTGEKFTASVSGVVAFGLFVQLDQQIVEGLVHVSDMGEEYFKFDASRHQLVGTRTQKRFRIGDAVRVKLDKVDWHRGQLTFTLAGSDTKRRRPRRPRP